MVYSNKQKSEKNEYEEIQETIKSNTSINEKNPTSTKIKNV